MVPYCFLQKESSKPPAKTPTQPKGPIQVRRDYNPKAPQTQQGGQAESAQFLISPITGEKIPAEKMEEHMRYGECYRWDIPQEFGNVSPTVIQRTLPPSFLAPLPPPQACRIPDTLRRRNDRLPRNRRRRKCLLKVCR